MASEIRVNKIENRSGLGTVTFADTGVDLSGIVTATTFSGSGASLTALPAAQLSGTLPAISAANLTNVPAANITGTLPAISAANLTSIPAANITGTLPALSAANLTSIPAANVTGTLPAISGANLTSLPAGNLTGTLPALSAASLTSIPAANIVGVCTSGLTKTGGFGALNLISTTSVSSEVNSVTISNSFDEYDVYMIIINGISPATDNRDLHAVVRDNGDITGDYSTSSYGVEGNSNIYGDAASAIRFNYNSVSHHLDGSWLREDFAMHMYMTGFPVNKTWRYWGQNSYSHGSDVGRGQGFVGQCKRSAAITAIKFYWQSGNFRPYGKIKLYGVS